MAVNNNQMTPLPPEIEKQISDRTDELTLNMPIDNDYQVGYVQGFTAGHETGATEWAGRAQNIFDLLDESKDFIEKVHNETGMTHKSNYLLQRIIVALAKYKEVGNG